MPSRDPQEAAEKVYARIREAGAGQEWARRKTREAREEVQRGIDEGRVKPPGKG